MQWSETNVETNLLQNNDAVSRSASSKILNNEDCSSTGMTTDDGCYLYTSDNNRVTNDNSSSTLNNGVHVPSSFIHTSGRWVPAMGTCIRVMIM